MLFQLSGVQGGIVGARCLSPVAPFHGELAQPTGLDRPVIQSYPWVAMEVETKLLRLFKPIAWGDRIDG